MVHLVCNAHLDPVWLWEWQEGAAEALSTFKIAADFCEDFGEFVFCHNEVILYEWVQEYDPVLFKRIQKLVAEGKWHIMGSWYLQPDMLMPCGESITRQILLGRKYFIENFNAFSNTVVNFDAFGHSRGVVQLMNKSGFNAYIRTRPDKTRFPTETDVLKWYGYDGSSVLVHHAPGYLTLRGTAVERVKMIMDESQTPGTDMVLWGIGNHGGGPSRVDLQNLRELIKEMPEKNIVHSTPDKYFAELREKFGEDRFQKVYTEITPWAKGCYTSQIRVKQHHRMLENELYSTEKMLSAACSQGIMEYPAKELEEATKDLLFTEFHDCLPGSGIKDVENHILQRASHGLEILSRLKFKAFIKLINSKPELVEGELPLYVYNPHPYEVESVLEAEFQMADQNWGDDFTFFHLYDVDGNEVPCQIIKERCNLSLDWRKRVCIKPVLKPMSMNTFVLKPYKVEQKPVHCQYRNAQGNVEIANDDMKIVINSKTGLIDEYSVGGVSYLKENAFALLAMKDDAESWGTYTDSIDEIAGTFELVGKDEANEISGVPTAKLDAVRVIEDGEVKTTVEAILKYNRSLAVVNYDIPKKGTQVTVRYRVLWMENQKYLKLSVPANFDGEFRLNDMCGIKTHSQDGDEAPGQKWIGLFGKDKAVTVINNSNHGFDCRGSELRVSMLRSPGYAALELADPRSIGIGKFLENRPILYPVCYHDHQDQGLREFTYWLNASDCENREDNIAKETVLSAQKPYAMAVFAAANDVSDKPVFTIDNDTIEVMAFKKAEYSDDYVIRLFEATGKPRKATLQSDVFGVTQSIDFAPFEVKTFFINKNKFEETDLIEGMCAK